MNSDNFALLKAWVYYKLRDESICEDERLFAETVRDLVSENQTLKAKIKELKSSKKKKAKRKIKCGNGSLLSH